MRLRETKSTVNSGFTLVELLVAMIMSALAVSAMYAVYKTMLFTTVNETDVVDMQQEMRTALDYLSRDIKMAGALVPTDYTVIASGSGSTILTLQTASSLYAFAVIDEDVEVTAGSTDNCSMSVLTPSMLASFSSGDVVRILRPQTKVRVGDSDFTVSSVADIDEVVEGSQQCEIVLKPLGNSDELSIRAGDVLVGVESGASNPSTISWSLDDTALVRSCDGGTAEEILDNVSSLVFEYLDENGDTTSESDEIKAVKITLTVEADGQLDGKDRTRQLSTIVYMRN